MMTLILRGVHFFYLKKCLVEELCQVGSWSFKG